MSHRKLIVNDIVTQVLDNTSTVIGVSGFNYLLGVCWALATVAQPVRHYNATLNLTFTSSKYYNYNKLRGRPRSCATIIINHGRII